MTEFSCTYPGCEVEPASPNAAALHHRCTGHLVIGEGMAVERLTLDDTYEDDGDPEVRYSFRQRFGTALPHDEGDTSPDGWL